MDYGRSRQPGMGGKNSHWCGGARCTADLRYFNEERPPKAVTV